MSDEPLPLVCTGRPVNDDGHPYGPECRRRLQPRHLPGAPSDKAGDWYGQRWETPTEHAQRARAAGWRIGPAGDAYCGRCARPDQQLVRLCRDLARGSHG
jgi:hypothetical protein